MGLSMLLRLSSAHPRTLHVYPAQTTAQPPKPLENPLATPLESALAMRPVSVHFKGLISQKSLPQLLYYQHLQASIVTVVIKRLISSLESALTKFASVTPLECALTKNTGGKGRFAPLVNLTNSRASAQVRLSLLSTFNFRLSTSSFSPLVTRHSSLPLVALTSSFSTSSKLFCTFLHSQKCKSFPFMQIHTLAKKHPGMGYPHQPPPHAVSCQLSTVSSFSLHSSLATRHSPLDPSAHDQTTHL